MNINELIKRLNEWKIEYGNIEVFCWDGTGTDTREIEWEIREID